MSTLVEGESQPMPRAVCPDCEQGKHGACVGDAWDDFTDQPAICSCWEENHRD